MNASKQNNTCIIWQTHKLDDGSLAEYMRLRESCRETFDTVALYDNSRNDFRQPTEYPDINFDMFDIDDLRIKYRLNNLRTPVSITPGNTVFPLLDFALHHPYAYYWLIEYDVRYTGNWQDFFFYFTDNISDLLGTTLYRHSFKPSWCWWKTLKPPFLPILRKKNWIRGLFPVMRISAAGIHAYIKANRRGWKGHYEVCMPTVLKHYGLTIEDIGGDGEFVAKKNVNRFYTNTPGSSGLGPGTFVCPPTKPLIEILPNKLYHAVK